MYGYIYITENLINNKKYIGKKQSNIFIPTYHGSGIYLLNAIKKYGEENFKTTLLEWCNSLSELNEKERYYIEINNAVNSDEYYNIATGGDGGNVMAGWTEDRKQQFQIKISELSSGRITMVKDNKMKRVQPSEYQLYLDQGWKKGGLSPSAEVCKQRSENMLGTKFMTNGVENIRVNPTDITRVNQLIELGYDFGYTVSEKRRNLQIKKSEENTRNKKMEEQKYLDSLPRCATCGKIITEIYGCGKYCSKKCASTHSHSQETKDLISNLNKTGVIGNKGKKLTQNHKSKISESIRKFNENSEKRVWVNNGQIEKHIFESQIADFENQGFVKGRKKDPNKVAWNKGLTKEDPRIRQNIEKRNNTMLQKYGTLNAYKAREIINDNKPK